MTEAKSQRVAGCVAAKVRSRSASPTICALSLVCVFFLLPGCGSGGSGGTGSGGDNVSTVSLPTITSLSPSSASAGGGAFTLTVNGTNFTASGTTVKWNGTSLTTTYVTSSQLTAPITSQMIATSGNATVTVTTADGTSTGASFLINVPSAPTITAAHAPLRTRYLRTNAFYDPNSLQFAPPHFSVYDSAHKQFFVSNPFMNSIDVFSAASESQTATVSVPMAWGIDISPTDGSLWAGTLFGDVYHVDTTALKVIARYPSSTIGPIGFAATTALALADGRLALQGTVGGGLGILGVDGFGSAIVWTPQSNEVDTGTSVYGSICPYSNGGFALDGTRQLILMTTVDENSSLPLCSYNTVTRVETDANFDQQIVTFIRQIIPSPDGSKFFLTTNLDGVDVFDAKTLQHLGRIGPTGYTMPNAAGGAVMSMDGKTLYLVDQQSGSIFGYDTSSYQQVSVVPHVAINDLQRWLVASAIDETGLIIGPIGHGVAFADTAAPESTTLTEDVVMETPSPNTGPLTGGTAITDAYSAGGSFDAPISKFYVGNSMVSGSTVSNHIASLSTPAASRAMPVDLTALFSDGAVITAPESFSYGPTILEVVTNAATADGAQQGSVVGYGFGNSASSLQISIGGQAATIQNLYGYAPVSPYPFPVETLTFTIPAGVAGVTTISLTSPSGTATAKFTYTPKSVSYPVNASLQQGIYDPHRDLYYFSDAAKIQVLSAKSGTWQTPITLPGTTGASRLIGIAESPDQSMLAVADSGGHAIYVLDPGNPASAVRYPTPAMTNSVTGCTFPPSSLAILDNKSVYYVAQCSLNPVAGETDFLKLDLTTGKFLDFQIGSVGTLELDGGRVLVSPDQSTVYLNMAGMAYRVQTSTDTLKRAPALNGGYTDGAISSDGSTISISGYITDNSLALETLTAYIDWETWLPTATFGQKLNHDGSILYQPLKNGVDLIERNTGRLLYRLQVPGTLADVYDAMFLGGTPGTIGYLTNSGVTLVDLSTLSIPVAASTPFPASSLAEPEIREADERPTNMPLQRAGKGRPQVTHIGGTAKKNKY